MWKKGVVGVVNKNVKMPVFGKKGFRIWKYLGVGVKWDAVGVVKKKWARVWRIVCRRYRKKILCLC